MSQMILERLRVERVRRFYQPLEIAFDPRANLIHGPNEAGKSTLVDALQAVLFYKYNSGPVAASLLPRCLVGQAGHGQLFPEVTLDFRIDDQRWRVFKRFRGQQSTLELTARESGQTLTADEAQAKLWSLLGATAPEGQAQFASDEAFATYGRAWPLLWVKQGRARDALQPSPPAEESLLHSMQDLIDQTLLPGPLTAQLDQAVAQRGQQYFTSPAMTTEKASASAPLHAARLRLAAIERQLTELDQRSTAYAETLEAQERNDREVAAAERELELVAAQQTALQERRALATQQAEALPALRGARDTAAAAQQLVTERLKHRRELETTIEAGTADVTAATAAAGQAQAANDAWGLLRPPLVAAVETSQRQHEAARRAVDRLRHHVAAGEAGALVGRLTGAVEQAAGYEQARDHARQQAESHQAFTAPALEALDQLVDAERQARAKLEAVQARVSVLALGADLPVTIGAEPAITVGAAQALERRIEADTEIRIGELARITIRPGQADLGDLRAAHQQALDAVQARLGELGVTDRDAALRRGAAHAAAATAEHEAAVQLQAVLGAHQAADLATLRQRLGAANGALEAATQSVASLTQPDDAPLPADLPAARAALTAAEDGVAALQTARDDATCQLQAHDQQAGQLGEAVVEAKTRLEVMQQAVATAQGQLAGQVASHGETAALLAAEEQQAAAVAAATNQLGQALTELASALNVTLEAGLEPAQQEERLLAELAQNEADLADLQTTATGLRSGLEELKTRRTVLRTQLEAAEVIGLQAQRDELQGDRDRAAAEVAAWELDRDALKLLHEKLEERQQQASQAGRQPLINEVQDLLRVWHHGALVDLSQEYQLAGLTRGEETEKFQDLSAGAREQVNTILRLAMGRLLARRFPVFMVLDEALESTDNDRFPLLAAILSQVSQDLQLLLFTWNAERYEGMTLLPAQKIDLAAACRKAAALAPAVTAS